MSRFLFFLPQLGRQNNRSAAGMTCPQPRRLCHEQLEPRQMLSVSAEPADFDGSFFVDGGDLAVWEQGFGSTSATPSQGDADLDADLDADVDGSDFLAWQRSFGRRSLPDAPIDWSVEIAARVNAGGTIRTANVPVHGI